MIDFSAVDALTFDCYGTLIDWEAGLLQALRPMVVSRGVEVGADELLETYARHETALEAGSYLSYKQVLAVALQRLAQELGFEPSDSEVAAFSRSPGEWPAFPDSAGALERLHARFQLGVITNCDDDLFALSREKLGAKVTWVVTAQQVGSYKPDLRNFEQALERIDVPHERIVHVAQSLYHDHVPAKQLGLTTVWVDRRHGREGFGATPPAEATPDLTVADMDALAHLASP